MVDVKQAWTFRSKRFNLFSWIWVRNLNWKDISFLPWVIQWNLRRKLNSPTDNLAVNMTGVCLVSYESENQRIFQWEFRVLEAVVLLSLWGVFHGTLALYRKRRRERIKETRAMNLGYIVMYYINIHVYIKRSLIALFNKFKIFESNKPNLNLIRLNIDLIRPNNLNFSTFTYAVIGHSLFEFEQPTIQTFTIIQQYKAADT